MKRAINFITAIAGVSLLLTFSSCLKNSKYYVDLSAVGASIDMPLAAANSNSPITLTFTPADTPSHFYVYVNVASPQKLGKAINATLGLDTAYMDQYNANNGTDFELLPDSDYTLSTMSLTVPAHQRLADATLTIFTNKIDASHNYVLPLTIVKADLPIENWNHEMINVVVKNMWDGVYSYHGTVMDPNRPQLSNNFTSFAGSTEVDLVTSGTSSDVQFWPGAQANAIPLWNTSSSGASYYGSCAPNYTFDPNTNLITSIKNSYINPSNGRTLSLNSADVSRYDPSSKTVYASFIMNQPGLQPVYIHDTLVYEHSR